MSQTWEEWKRTKADIEEEALRGNYCQHDSLHTKLLIILVEEIREISNTLERVRERLS